MADPRVEASKFFNVDNAEAQEIVRDAIRDFDVADRNHQTVKMDTFSSGCALFAAASLPSVITEVVRAHRRSEPWGDTTLAYLNLTALIGPTVGGVVPLYGVIAGRVRFTSVVSNRNNVLNQDLAAKLDNRPVPTNLLQVYRGYGNRTREAIRKELETRQAQALRVQQPI
ncbi:MAG: hypothetical protein EOO38_01585 [Cytophagaceae bacterium]|nr:MAG: hypothetical protein EOO38_01585 [Cytophagaceae bacterium]